MASKYVTQAEAPNRSETNKYLNASGHWTVPSGGGGGGGTASDIEYDNTDSGLSADNVQDAIDEIAQGGGGGSDERAMISDIWSSSTAYTVGKYAIDGNKLYKCTVANTNMRPSTSPLYWVETDVCSEIYESNIYSTTEKRIGTWIDGKPLYQKTFTVTSQAPSTNMREYVDLSSLHIDTFVGYSGTAERQNFTSLFPNVYYNEYGAGLESNVGFFRKTNQQFEIVRFNQSTLKYIVTIHYTKNTD